MKLPKSVQIKETTSLYAGKYNYKIVLICPVAVWFRGKKYDYTLSKLDEVEPIHYTDKWSRLKNSDELNYCFLLLNALKNFDETLYDLRVESPRISIYTNESSYIEKIASLNETHVKFISIPGKTIKKLEPGKVVVKTLDYDYKVYLSTIKKKDNSSFIKWATDNKKVRLTKRCIRDLSQNISWGGSYFYVKDVKTLTMVKMFVGSDISRIEQVIKS